ncbi:hypothetical protein EST38_g13318 [Candolleomyces aberdarensis]|uniref:DUF6535 domain-containing protein n=1 Tax=Candolleomyces aberdarensis TaxID=2316362 RepID=A0A4V1Q1R8_9AGAR|nr:hypothetical protein EST38_g13318 [Candolleomyces aberdarensis]
MGGRGRRTWLDRVTEDPRDFRRDAKIWHLYLQDAETAGKERAALAQSSVLDAVLLFVSIIICRRYLRQTENHGKLYQTGLFAGVVSSFVIDARRDLQEGSEQILLGDIRDAVRRRAVPIVQIPISAKAVSALWLISLYITLFSAVMGVLAKAWLSNLVSPALNRDAKDAYHRYRLDNNASALQTIMTLMFLLVQLACILFLAGLVVQVTADNPSIGRVILAFCASGGLIYLTVTFLPLYFPFSPFRTPLLDLLLSLKPSGRGALFPGGKMRPKEIDECLAEILNLHLIRSPDPSRVDEAVAELALPSFKTKWAVYLYKNEALDYMLKGFYRCALTPTNDKDEKDKILSNYIVVFLRFLDHFDAQLITVDDRILSYINSLREISESGPSMLLWNFSHVTLRPLLLCLKMKALCLSTQSSDDPKIFDFHPDEVALCPWRWVLEPINSSHRQHFMSAACHGVMKGQKNIKKISTSILNLTLAQSM